MTQQQIEALYAEIRTLKEQKNAVILAHYYAEANAHIWVYS